MTTSFGNGEEVLLFAYGTLRSAAGGAMYRRLAAAAVDVVPAECRGRLFDAGDYPAAVPSEHPLDRIRGEAFVLRRRPALELLATLDRYEGVAAEPPASLFTRGRTSVVLDDGREVSSWIYWYARPVEGLARIGEGAAAAEWMPASTERDS